MITHPTPIPPGIRDGMETTLEGITDPDVRWRIRRAVEQAYLDGYGEGHSSGRYEQRQDDRAEAETKKASLAPPVHPIPAGRVIDGVDLPEGLLDGLAKAIRDGCYIFVAEYPPDVARQARTSRGQVADVDAAAMACALHFTGRDPVTGRPL
jgi:hypothetical protein